jgi:hypothetical protein
MDPIECYLLASVEPDGISQRGSFDLALIPATWIDDIRVARKWPCAPVTGVVRGGCLYSEGGVVNTDRLRLAASGLPKRASPRISTVLTVPTSPRALKHLKFDYRPERGEAA